MAQINPSSVQPLVSHQISIEPYHDHNVRKYYNTETVPSVTGVTWMVGPRCVSYGTSC
ncbi:hypothetical protein BDR03DRAFT_974429, partial [Suillus americanus]